MAPRYLAAALLAAACGSQPSIALDKYAGQRQAAECTRLVRCGLFENAAACSAYFRVIPDASLAAAVKDHKIRYDGAAAAECVAALAKRSCDDTSREARVPPARCDTVFSGEVKAGQACAFGAECASGTCTLPQTCTPASCCAGTCADTAASPVGGPCHLTSDCVADSYCGIDQLCHALGGDNAPCYADDECDYGLACIEATNPGRCHALAAEGAACPYGRCALAGDTCNAAMTCVPVGLPGAPCTGIADCSPYGTCDTAAGTCADAPDVGMPCGPTCEGDAWCDSVTTGQCQALLSDTTPCNTDLECVSGYCEEGPVFDSCAERPVCD